MAELNSKQKQAQMQQIIYDGNFGFLAEADIFNDVVKQRVAAYLGDANSMPSYEQCPAKMLAAFNAGDFIEVAAMAYFMHML